MLCAGGIALSLAAQHLDPAGASVPGVVLAGETSTPLGFALASFVGADEIAHGSAAVAMRMAGDASFLAGGVWLALLVAWRMLRGAVADIARAFRPARGHGEARPARAPRLQEKQIGAPPNRRKRRRDAPAGPPPPALTEIELAALTPVERVRWRSQARAAGMMA